MAVSMAAIGLATGFAAAAPGSEAAQPQRYPVRCMRVSEPHSARHGATRVRRVCLRVVRIHPVGISRGEVLKPAQLVIDAPWMAEVKSTHEYTQAEIDADTKLPDSSPDKYFLAEKPEWERQHRCGAVYIGGGFVLTAAHCVAPPGADGKAALLPNFLASREVRLGPGDLSRPGAHFRIVAAVVHRGYFVSTNRDDIALLRLDMGGAGDPPEVTPARILGDGPGGRPVAPGDSVFVTGWGATSPTTGGAMLRSTSGNPLRDSARLKMVALNIVPNARCDAVDTLHGTISAAVLCAGSSRVGDDACVWDSGGPMIRASDMALVGLVSRGKGCGLKDTPAVYTPVSPYRAWIEKAKHAPTGRVTIQ